MKNNCFAIFLFSFSMFFIKNYLLCANCVQLKGIIEAPIGIKKVPEFTIQFAGKQAINKEDGIYSFELSEGDPARVCQVLICEDVIVEKENKADGKKNRKTNVLKRFLVDTTKKNKYYELIYNDILECFEWVLKDLASVDTLSPDEKQDNNRFEVPQGTLVFLMLPDLVEKVDTWCLQNSDHYIQAPRIILKNLEENLIKDASNKSLSKNIEYACYFEKSKIAEIVKSPKVKVSVQVPEGAMLT